MSESSNGLKQINIAKIKEEAKEISIWIESGVRNGLSEKYSNFSRAYPVLFKNLVENKMSYEEIEVLLDTFDRAQNHFIDNFNKNG